jgi:hypothetical protein
MKILDGVRNDPYAFLPYTIKEGEKAEDIAYLYYGSTEYVWLVWLSNKTVDPYFEWPLSEHDLFKSIAKKYKTRAQDALNRDTMNAYEIFDWTMNETITSNIEYYEKDGVRISPDTYHLNVVDLSGWQAVRVFDVEHDRNESMRNVQLLNNSYLRVADENLKIMLGE